MYSPTLTNLRKGDGIHNLLPKGLGLYRSLPLQAAAGVKRIKASVMVGDGY